MHVSLLIQSRDLTSSPDEGPRPLNGSGDTGFKNTSLDPLLTPLQPHSSISSSPATVNKPLTRTCTVRSIKSPYQRPSVTHVPISDLRNRSRKTSQPVWETSERGVKTLRACAVKTVGEVFHDLPLCGACGVPERSWAVVDPPFHGMWHRKVQ